MFKSFSVTGALLVLAFSAEVFGAPIINRASNLCMDVKGNDARPGATVQVYACHGGANQDWVYTSATELRTYGGTRCLDVSGANGAPGGALITWECNSQSNQKFRFQPDGSIVVAQSGLCLEAVNGASSGASVRTWTCNGSAVQKWSGTSDVQAPTAPTNLRTSALTCRSVNLAWNASTDNVGVTSYDIYHDGQLMASTTGTTLNSNLTLTPGAKWGLYVVARDAAGNPSQSSSSLQLNVPFCETDTQKPSVPTGLRGQASGTTVNLDWNASTDNVGVTGYDIYRNGARVASTPSRTYVDSGLNPNQNYQYAVLAKDAQGNQSALTAAINVTTGASCSSAICLVNEIATETDLPWGLISLPDGAVLYTRRDAKEVMLLNPATGAKRSIGTIPNVDGTDGEGGLMGLAASPQFPGQDPWLYILHTTANDNRIVRVQYVNDSLNLSSLQVLLPGLGRNKYHNGGRLAYGPDGKLYAAMGDAQNADSAQNLNSMSGKILRLNTDGSRPADNPFNNYVWSYGHRNPQGLAFDSRGRLWAQEFGNTVMDETNLIVRGGNYGWPACEGTSGNCAISGYIAPKFTIPTDQGSCSGIAIVNEKLFIACLRGTKLVRLDISGDQLLNRQNLLVGTYGRLRTVEKTLDNGLWLTTSNNGDKDSTANNSNEKILKVNLGF